MVELIRFTFFKTHSTPSSSSLVFKQLNEKIESIIPSLKGGNCKDYFRMIIQSVEEVLIECNVNLPPKKKADLIVMLYEDIIEEAP